MLLVVVTMIAFAVGGNQLYYATTYEWRSPASSIGTVIYLLRRPMAMPWEAMGRNSILWPLDSDEPSPVTVLFLLGFTLVTIWIMANLYKAVVVVEYSAVVQQYHTRAPADLTDEPWPSASPAKWMKRQHERYLAWAYEKRVAAGKRAEIHLGMEAQKRKQKALRERVAKELHDAKEAEHAKSKAKPKPKRRRPSRPALACASGAGAACAQRTSQQGRAVA
jgi:hypothetical protein